MGAIKRLAIPKPSKRDADIIVMVHPDYQYDPTVLPQIIEPIERGVADVVLGSRLMGESPIEQACHGGKYYGNRLRTKLENLLSDSTCRHTTQDTELSADKCWKQSIFVQTLMDLYFDQEVIVQVVDAEFAIAEIPVPTRYFPEASLPANFPR